MTAPQDVPAKPGRFLGPITAGMIAVPAAALFGSLAYAATAGTDLKILQGTAASATLTDFVFVFWCGAPVILGSFLAQRVVHDLPRVRRLSYLLRELVGIHPANGPLVQVTDGGFYDNLGLIELFRRGCTRIYCIDASGDTPPPATTLAGVLTLAYQELGVKVRLDQTAFDNTPGTGSPTKPDDALTALNPRLAKSGIITGEFTYPPESGLTGERNGLLVVAKASLWDRLPYPLLAYAMDNPTFPNDSTGDQWFDDNQYSAYTALGRELGEGAVQAMVDLETPKLAEGANQTQTVEPPRSPTRNGAKKPGAMLMAMRLLLSRLAIQLARLASTSDH